MTQLKSTEIIRLVGAFLTALFALLTALGIAIDPVLQAKALELISAFIGFMAVMWPLLEWARANVWSKESVEDLGKAALKPKPNPTEAKAATEALGVPKQHQQLVLEAASLAAQGVLTGNWLALVTQADWGGLAGMVTDAARRVPTQSETDAKAMEGL